MVEMKKRRRRDRFPWRPSFGLRRPYVRSPAARRGTAACIDHQAWGRKLKGHRRRCVRGRGSAPVRATLARRHGRRRSGERRHGDGRSGPHSNPAFYSAGTAGAQTPGASIRAPHRTRETRCAPEPTAERACLLNSPQAEVAEWQTRRSQKPLGRKAHVGSTPTFGTISESNVARSRDINCCTP